MTETLEPSTFEEAAATLADASAARRTVRIRGAGTKASWGTYGEAPDVELRTTALNEIVEHNAGDLTAVLEAGVPVSRAQDAFATEGQMLALDPALGRGADRHATIGGMIATGDCGPLRHRYGQPRDLVVGMTVALSDGTIARSGSKVIKNVAGYDIAKLFAGSFGTLGLILSVNVRLHPLPLLSASALGASGDPDVLRDAAIALAQAPLELEALDVAWRAGRGGVLARVAGAEAVRRAQRIATLMNEAGLEEVDVTDDDDSLWARQRAGQRAQNGRALMRVAGRPRELADVLRLTQEVDGTLVGRAALGSSYVELEPAAVAAFRAALPTRAVAVVLDAPPELREELDPWGAGNDTALALMRRIKQRFDPQQTCNSGLFVGGI
jgi:glycolate dehydrogenase FAD-binding subunit